MISINNSILRSIVHKSLRPVTVNSVRFGSGAVTKIGRREIVGYGFSGEPVYYDSWQYPFPAVRYREITPELKALKEKEKGDWKSLSIEEKKCLYRVSFCQTFAEMDAPTGEWKKVLGGVLIAVSLGVWILLLNLTLSRNPNGRPPTFSEPRRQAQLRRILDLKMNPIEGISSKWDYENNKWK
ncbi:hypothetical protein O3M35_012137 [Rhynocoris fuscipes]|uniref:Cytochrome c oxidase subunit 4 n=1 Tax=Rhynocoris fuscipes TaxID=488301 RepID=A0AAW1CSQ5_9HEMI